MTRTTQSLVTNEPSRRRHHRHYRRSCEVPAHRSRCRHVQLSADTTHAFDVARRHQQTDWRTVAKQPSACCITSRLSTARKQHGDAAHASDGARRSSPARVTSQRENDEEAALRTAKPLVLCFRRSSSASTDTLVRGGEAARRASRRA